jgi:hypothetical protein
MIDDLCLAPVRNEIKKNKPYHLAHTSVVFIKKFYISRVFPPTTETDNKKHNGRKSGRMRKL